MRKGEKMLVVGINGSPRKGNSYTLLENFLKGAEKSGFETKLIDACKIKISPCMECGFCSKEGICRIKDEMEEIRNDLENAAHIAVASPVFFFGISGQLKILIDRCQPFWVKKYQLQIDISKKFNFQRKGFFFSTGGFDKDITFKGGELVVKTFFDSLYVKYEDKIFVPSMEFKGDIFKREDCIEKAYNLGRGLND
jgi:hypothetical protein